MASAIGASGMGLVLQVRGGDHFDPVAGPDSSVISQKDSALTFQSSREMERVDELEAFARADSCRILQSLAVYRHDVEEGDIIEDFIVSRFQRGAVHLVGAIQALGDSDFADHDDPSCLDCAGEKSGDPALSLIGPFNEIDERVRIE